MRAFFAHESRFFLTGGAALAGFYFGHRTTEDLDFFSPPGPDLAEAARAVEDAARECQASVQTASIHPDFRRLVVSRGEENCIVDLVIDRAPAVDASKALFGSIRVDTLREIAANKIGALIGRSEIKDLVDLRVLVRSGIDLHQAFADASRKEASAEPATLAWVLSQIALGPDARMPGGVDPIEIDTFRTELMQLLRSEAFAMAKKSP